MATRKFPLPNLNLETATFECTFGNGCDGKCCQAGRPPVSDAEKARIDENLDRFLPHMSDAARKAVAKEGYLSKRVKSGMPMMRVIDGWCVFFHQGCVLHKVGMADGDKFAYKPAPCSLFPLEADGQDRWYVRQHGYKGEQWDIFCLAPTNSATPATRSLKEEIKLAVRITAQKSAVQPSPPNKQDSKSPQK